MLKNQEKRKIIGACLENCVHVAGILNFINICEEYNYKTIFLGPAVSIKKIIKAIQDFQPNIVGISYRLTPEIGINYLKNFIHQININNLQNRVYLLGCLPELGKKAKKLQFFKKIFYGGESVDEIYPILNQNNSKHTLKVTYPDNLLERIKLKTPYPIIRTHFGLPSFEETLKGMKEIAESKTVDVISIAPDQPAQEWLQRPLVLNTLPSGAGGVPIRSKENLIEIYNETRCGNKPLLRIYAGTQDLVKNSELFHQSIKNAWTATPIFWYSELDGRGPRKLQDAIRENFENIRWHVQHNIPVEINDPHQWGLRMATDYMVVADCYLSARIAKELGVQTYIEQLMFNTPMGNSYKMDLARVLAMIEITESLASKNFRILRETRAGLAYFSPDPIVARGQLVASTLHQMGVQPDIIHVVSYCEANHAAKASDIIESVTLIKRVIQDAIIGLPDFTKDPEVQNRKQEILHDAHLLIKAYESFASSFNEDNPYLSPNILTEAVKIGLFDAPQLKGNSIAKGEIKTRILNGKCVAVDNNQKFLSEFSRLEKINLLPDNHYEKSIDFANTKIKQGEKI
ncbi:MAG: cobalamin B12-binding domain-containing protein [Promethearchaeota archaeon]